MSNRPNRRRNEGRRTEHGPRWENKNPGKGCNSTHVARARRKWRRRGLRKVRRQMSIGDRILQKIAFPSWTDLGFEQLIRFAASGGTDVNALTRAVVLPLAEACAEDLPPPTIDQMIAVRMGASNEHFAAVSEAARKEREERQGHYILDEQGNPVPEKNYRKFIDWEMKFPHLKIVARTTIGDVADVSTVFLGSDRNFGDGPLQLFETMVFDGKLADRAWHYATRKEAEQGHAAAVMRVHNAEGIHLTVEDVTEKYRENLKPPPKPKKRKGKKR